jgi:hypothetical protein
MDEPVVGRPQDAARGRWVLTCAGCGKGIELCSFCNRSECVAAVCYPCLLVDLHESVAQPHPHGG